MSGADVFLALWVVILPLAFVLMAVASALFGRRLADLEYQRETGFNGVRTIQSYVNLRIHGNRVLLALVLVANAIMILVGISLEVQQLAEGILVAVLLAVFTATSILDWRDDRRQVRILIAEELERERGRVRRDPEREAADGNATR